MLRRKSFVWLAVAIMATMAVLLTSHAATIRVPRADDVPVYRDVLLSGWEDWSWKTTVNLANSAPVHSGSASISVTYSDLTGWGALQLATNAPLDAADYSAVRFWIHGGSAGGQTIAFQVIDGGGGNWGNSYFVTPQANTWTEVTVALSEVGSPATIGRLVWQEYTGGTQPTFYVDDITIVAGGTAPPPGTCDPPLYSFETGVEGWGPAFYADSSAVTVTQVISHATDGTHAARLEFNHDANAGHYKAIFQIDIGGAGLDLSSYDVLRFDLWKSGQPARAGLAISTGSGWTWHESVEKALVDGDNFLSFDLKSSTWKSAATGWSNTGTIADLNEVHRISVIVFPTLNGPGEAFLDNVRLCTAPPPPPATPTWTPAPTLPPLPTPPPPPPPAGPDEFVSADGNVFRIGRCTFRYAGVNNYYMHHRSNFMIDQVLDGAQEIGFDVLRVWGFLDYGSVSDWGATVPHIHGVPPEQVYYYQYWDTDTNSVAYNDAALRQLDYAVYAAGQRGVKLIVVLTNNWKDFGGMDQYVAWHGGTHHDDFYTDPDIKETYKNWVSHLLNHVNSYTGRAYKDDPTIMAWELANEPRCKGSGPYPPSANCSTATITAWADEMSAYVKSIDPNHLVSVGDEGFFNNPQSTDWTENGSEGVDFNALIRLNNVDFGTFHLYPGYWSKSAAWGTDWITRHIAAGVILSGTATITKPVILEEFGWQDEQTRPNVYETWLTAVYTNGGAGDLVWMLAGLEDRWELLFSFESGEQGWMAGQPPTYADSSAIAATQSISRSTLYTASLRLEFDHQVPTHTKAVYWVQEDWDFSAADELHFDLWKEGQPAQVAVALSTGDSWLWQESPPQPLTDGWNHVVIDLTRAEWKSAFTNWEHTGVLTHTEDIRQLSILLFPSAGGMGEAYLDNVRLLNNDEYYPNYDGFTFYVTSPITPVLRAHALQMRATQVCEPYRIYLPVVMRNG